MYGINLCYVFRIDATRIASCAMGDFDKGLELYSVLRIHSMGREWGLASTTNQSLYHQRV